MSLPWCCRSRRWPARSALPRWQEGARTCTQCRVVCTYSSGTPGTPRVAASENPSRSASCSCWPWPYCCLLPLPFGVRGNSEGWGAQEGAYCSLGLRKTEWRKLTSRCCRIKYENPMNWKWCIFVCFTLYGGTNCFLINWTRRTRESLVERRWGRLLRRSMLRYSSVHTQKIYIYIYSCASIYIQTRMLYLFDKVH